MARHPSDVVLLFLAILGVVLLTFPAPGPTAIDQSVANVVKELPGLLGWFWELSYDILIGWAAVLLLIAAFSKGRRALLVQEVCAGGLAFGLGVLAANAAGTPWSESFQSLTSSNPPPIYLAVRLAIATAVVVAASPHMSRPIRYVGRWVLWFGALAGIALGVTYPIGVVAGFLVGVGTAALVHLVSGSPTGTLTLDQVATALDDIGVAATDLRDAAMQPRGVALVLAATPAGEPLLVKIYGRDAWDGRLLASMWTSLWHRGETFRFGASRREMVEHEAFLTLLAEREGVPVLDVIAAGASVESDALLVVDANARPMASVPPEEVDDDFLAEVWKALERLHSAGLAHGHLDGDRIMVRPDGTPALADFSRATAAAPDSLQRTDHAQLLVTIALVVGAERAVAGAEIALGSDGLSLVLPYLQPAVFDRATRRLMHERGVDLDELRKLAAQSTGVDPPELEKIRRVTAGSIAVVVVIGIAAYMVISALAQVGLQTLIDEFQGADWTWLVAALLLSPVIQAAQAFSTIGASIRPVRYLPSLALQYSIQFIALAVPSSAARVALEVRFFQRLGVEPGGAAAVGVIDSVCGFAVQVLLILIITLSGLASLDLSSSDTSSSSSSTSSSSHGGLLTLLVVLLVLAAIAALAIPKYRAVVRAAIPKTREAIRNQRVSVGSALQVLRMPPKLALIFFGNLTAQVLQAIVLGMCLKAFGHEASLGGLILVNTFVSLFAGFMPVPGGMGVSEAAYTAGLVALGVPDSAAMATAIAFRLVTFYLPPIWGGFAMRWLRRNSYV
ncbi:MAG TPA: lysylphosphatidylglycerol synthase domain-containing protein [Actinomycetota bacterium]|nr:lysylphosphatidylglycerol synthase domain-containing protein [Actinomycetota bacterium]